MNSVERPWPGRRPRIASQRGAIQCRTCDFRRTGWSAILNEYLRAHMNQTGHTDIAVTYEEPPITIRGKRARDLAQQATAIAEELSKERPDSKRVGALAQKLAENATRSAVDACIRRRFQHDSKESTNR